MTGGRNPVEPKPADEYRGSVKLDTDAAAADRPATAASTRGAAGLALLAAATLDGVPESLALGISLTEGTGGIALLAAIFVSNLPEALVGAASMREQGRSPRQVIGLWTACAAVVTIAVVAGAAFLTGSDPAVVSLPLAFAAGAVIAALADTIMPEAFEHGGPAVALSTAAGSSCHSCSLWPDRSASGSRPTDPSRRRHREVLPGAAASPPLELGGSPPQRAPLRFHVKPVTGRNRRV